MATNLYEELDLPKDATADQIRKAYKKRALKTHPDRLSPNATPDEKAASEDLFRKVNNAYEVLTDPQKRKEYDRYGVWPPPDLDDDEPLPRRPSGNGHSSFGRHRPTPRSPFGDHFFSQPFPSPTFTDPFTLFDSIFGDFPFQNHSRPSPYRPHSRSDDPFQMAHRMHQEMMGNMFAHFERDTFNAIPDRHNVGFVPPMPRLPAPSSGNRRWVEESFVTSTVNGVTQTIQKRRDWDGNEHVTRTFPDGREVYTINGEQQSSHRGYIEPPVISRPPPIGPPPPYQGHNTSYNPSRKYEQSHHHHSMPTHQAQIEPPRRGSQHYNAYPMNTNTNYHRRGGW